MIDTVEYSIGSGAAVGVVDTGQRLGAAERRTTGRTHVDVFHLAAARLWVNLLAHHPGQRVDDVRFARSVARPRRY